MTGHETPLRNPVVPGFHPDPSVCRLGQDYYLACSSFEYYPGVPIFHSRDLAAWRQISNALDRPSQLRLETAPSSGGIYAPTLRHHAGRFWLITTNVSDRGHFIVTADDPAGPWSDPTVVDGVPGVDPDLTWDEDGTCWCTYATFGAEAGHIMQVPLDPERGAILDTPHRLWSGTGLAAPEAPHLYRIGEYWYLLIAEGGTARGHSVSVARGPAVSGPFEGHTGNPVLSHRSTSSPIQNTGHGDLAQAPDGSWRLLLLGVRPRGGIPGYHVLGRETFLAEVDWADGWPRPRPVVLDAPVVPGAEERDDFDGPVLGLPWLSVRQRPQEAWSLQDRPGWLTLHASGDTLDGPLPTFVGRRQQHPDCRVRARIDAGGGTGGLAVRLDEHHHYRIEATADVVRCVARIGPLSQTVATRPATGGTPLILGIDIDAGPSDGAVGEPPDRLRLSLDNGEGSVTLAELDGRYLSTEVAGGFTGRVVGMYAADGMVAFDWYEYRGAGGPEPEPSSCASAETHVPTDGPTATRALTGSATERNGDRG